MAQNTKRPEKLKGPHHFTGITADVATNVDFWCRVLGLRFVKNTLNFETTFRYHTYFGDEEGHPGSVVTFLEFKEAPAGRPGCGDIFRLVLRVASYDSLEYWMDRLIANQTHSEMLRLDPTQPQSLVFQDPEGHDVELMVSDSPNPPLAADADDIPAEHRILGIEGPRSFTTLEETLPFAQHIGFRQDGDRLVLDGSEGQGRWYFAPPPHRPSGDMHVGVWHHIAYGVGSREELQAYRDYATTGPAPYTVIFDHYFFDSCYAMSPGGRVELCTSGPGFTLDEKLEDLGDRLCLSPASSRCVPSSRRSCRRSSTRARAARRQGWPASRPRPSDARPRRPRRALLSMRLATYEHEDALRPALAVGDRLVDAGAAAQRAGLGGDPRTLASVRALLTDRADDLERLHEAAAQLTAAGESVALADVRLGPPIPDPGKILCVGLNYREHATEARLDEPEVPLIFAKFANTLIGDGAPIRLPAANARHVDYEGEVAVVIGSRVYAADERQALTAVAGWMAFNDVSARDLQTQTSQWTVGKSPDTFGPCGPCLVLDDALRDGGLELRTRVNGELVQCAHTDQMIFSVARIVAFLSRTMTLVPGDIVVTGTPEGVGAHRSPPRYLGDGDVVEITVGGERLSNPVVAT